MGEEYWNAKFWFYCSLHCGSAVLGIWICSSKKKREGKKTSHKPCKDLTKITHRVGRYIKVTCCEFYCFLVHTFFIVATSNLSSHWDQWIWDNNPSREFGVSVGQSVQDRFPWTNWVLPSINMIQIKALLHRHLNSWYLNFHICIGQWDTAAKDCEICSTVKCAFEINIPLQWDVTDTLFCICLVLLIIVFKWLLIFWNKVLMLPYEHSFDQFSVC